MAVAPALLKRWKQIGPLDVRKAIAQKQITFQENLKLVNQTINATTYYTGQEI